MFADGVADPLKVLTDLRVHPVFAPLAAALTKAGDAIDVPAPLSITLGFAQQRAAWVACTSVHPTFVIPATELVTRYCIVEGTDALQWNNYYN